MRVKEKEEPQVKRNHLIVLMLGSIKRWVPRWMCREVEFDFFQSFWFCLVFKSL